MHWRRDGFGPDYSPRNCGDRGLHADRPSYNGLVQLRVRADSAWSDIDVQLKRRHDLIPNLVETVKGYAAHEKGTFENIAKFRSAAMQPPRPPIGPAPRTSSPAR